MAHASDQLLPGLRWPGRFLRSPARDMLGKGSTERRCQSHSEVARLVGNAEVIGLGVQLC